MKRLPGATAAKQITREGGESFLGNACADLEGMAYTKGFDAKG
jgi:hypothetical protein